MIFFSSNKNKFNVISNEVKRSKKFVQLFNKFFVRFRFSLNNGTKVFLFITLLAVLLFSSCENDIKVVQALGQKKVGIEEAKNIEAYQSTGGKVKAKLTAPLMYKYLYDTSRYEFPKSLHVDFYDSTTHVESQLFARYGTYLENDRKVYLKDSVIVFNIKRDTLWTKDLTWDQDKQIFYTNKPIHLVQNSSLHQNIYGRGLRADQSFKWFTIDSAGQMFSGKQNVINVPDSSL